jgi:hypothetical protein
MELFNSILDSTSIFGLIVYCIGMTVVMGALAWASHLDRRRELRR